MTPCPCCSASLDPPFYTGPPVPVHSCLMLDTAAEARAFATGPVVLAACPACGFVTNTAFDPKWSAYAPNYEDQQSFSPTFSRYAVELARDLVSRHDLVGKRAVEIGCSKGDFLYLLASEGRMRGVGIDPSALPGRVAKPPQGQFRLIQALYDDTHLTLPADLLCCRHTLEHIGPVAAMLDRMHRHMRRNPGAVLFLDIPDATRVWAEGAFEDVYYEHCSYFSPGSLGRALRGAGFAVTDLRRDYGDQYLSVEAVLDPAQDRSFAIEEPPDETARLIARFADAAETQKARWRAWLNTASATGRRVAIWGSGSKCVSFIKAVAADGHHPALCGIIDINPHRAGKYAPGLGLPISAPEALPRLTPDTIVVMNPIYMQEIAARCAGEGWQAELLPLR